MKILLISGSIRKESYNTKIIKLIQKYFDNKVDFEPIIYDRLGQLPFFSPDIDKHTLEEDNSPLEVLNFRKNISDADFIIISTPEYAFEIPGVLKNALDWLVSSGELVDKKITAISSSTSPMGGKSAFDVLIKLLNILSTNVYEENELNIGKINKKIDENNIFEDDLKNEIINFVENFINNDM